ncbi:MAG: hypothetical protein IIZ96_02135 [Oscillospiraceae bacterium]|nr:hypothetical protein [Oscillospiraceae bacterium]
MVTIKFYHDPLLTRDHRVVRKGRVPKSQSSAAGVPLYSVTVPNLTPVWSGEMTIDIKRQPLYVGDEWNNNVPAPNYAEIVDPDHGDITLRYFVAVRTVTTDTMVATFSVDWWGTYGGWMHISAGRKSRGSSGYYGIEARFAHKPTTTFRVIGDPDQDVTVGGVTIPKSRTYCVAETLQIYKDKDNDWPQEDGQPRQVTVISRNFFTMEDIAGTGTYAGDFLAMMTAEQVVIPDGTLNPPHYNVISVMRRQIIPTDMLHGATAGDEFFSTSPAEGWCSVIGDPGDGALTAACGLLVAETGKTEAGAVGGTPQPFTKLSRDYVIQSRSDDAPTNDHRRRLFLGNRHTRTPLDDLPIAASAAPQDLAVVHITLTLNDCFLFELEQGDRATDITAIFEAGVVYNTEQEMRYQSGDARALGAISSAIGAVGQIAGGAAVLATGNPLGLLSIASGAATAANIPNNLQYRGREVVSSGGSTAIADAVIGELFGLVEVEVDNAAEREQDALRHGFVTSGTGGVLDGALVSTTLDGELVSPATTAPIQISDAIITHAWRAGSGSGTTGGWLLALPSDELMLEAEADLARGIIVVAADATTL